MGFLELLIGTLSNIFTPCTLYEISQSVVAAEGVGWEEYAEEVRELMCRELGFEKFEGDYFQKMAFRKKYVERAGLS